MNAITSNPRPGLATVVRQPVPAKKRPQPTPGLASPWYSKADMETLFGVGVRTIEKWVSAGRLPAPVKRGRKWTMWPKAKIDALLAEWQGGAA